MFNGETDRFLQENACHKINKTLKRQTVFKEEDANTKDLNTDLQFLTNPSDEPQSH